MNKQKRLHKMIIIFLIFCFVIGEYVCNISDCRREHLPPIIRAEQKKIKVKLQISDRIQIADKSLAVYKHVEGEAENVKQENLIDKTELPVDLKKVEQYPY